MPASHPASEPARPSSDSPSNTRHWVVVFGVTLAVVQYIDRVCMSQTTKPISEELGLSKTEMGAVFAAFAWAYALFEIPTGWLGDWLGARKVLIRVTLWWSFFTVVTGWAWNRASLIAIRFLFGMGEAGCFPNLAKAFTVWLPWRERTRAQGILWMGARWGGAFTPMLVAWVLHVVGSWRIAFWLFGLLGVVWCAFFLRWYRDNPKDHPGVNVKELALLEGAEANAKGHGDVPWGVVMSSRTVWLLWAQYFCLAYGWYFYITWLPTYLQEARGLDTKYSALLAGLPLFFGGIGAVVAGMTSAWLARRLGSVTACRRAMAMTGYILAGVFLVISAYIQSPTLAMVVMGLASFANDLTLPGSWSTCMDVGGPYAGTLSGSMNMMGNFAGGIGPIVVGWILDKTSENPNWEITFWISGAIYFAGALCWLGIDPVTPITRKPNPPELAEPAL